MTNKQKNDIAPNHQGDNVKLTTKGNSVPVYKYTCEHIKVIPQIGGHEIFPGYVVTDKCPYCKKPHIHSSFGLKTSHCWKEDSPYRRSGYEVVSKVKE